VKGDRLVKIRQDFQMLNNASMTPQQKPH